MRQGYLLNGYFRKIMHVGEQDRDLDVHREVDAGSADAAYMVQWLPL